ncbi:insulinase family protein [Treponema sp.]|uniref:insulinase family protein n=1 Tax=Treponema sp. TaxID=166 RepID=UPI00298E2361|nr:insulinase family protein [Treponema sp.]MCQ2241240.1 insulinase family protein [Treponema sp.]
MKKSLVKNDVYKGFKVLDVVDVKDFDSTGIYLKHEKSGLEVFHLLNDDRENLFAFAFRTPSQDSTGAAHVLEHSVLCGSKNYPSKDPFLQLTKQSINTYLNAFTASDRTVFPSSSLIKADYFNIMSVYADAVFFPLLKPEVFLQECWRLEPDEKNGCSIQGVVFNEMKGNYSSFNSVASDEVANALWPDSVYNLDSGGDPLVIPSLTLEKLRAFHKKYYCTNNCLVFLCGNIPTEMQLDFLDEHVISKVSSFGKKTVIKDPAVKSPKKIFRAYAPSENDRTGKDNSTVALSWSFGRDIRDDFSSLCEITMLYDLLLGSDSAPLRNVLLKKFPDSAVSPLSGPSVTSFHNSFTIAFSEMKESQKNEFRKTVYDVFEDLGKNGFPENDVARALMDFEIRNTEVQRSPSGGPFSLSLLRSVLRGWTYGLEPWKFISVKKETEEFKKVLASDKDYLKKLVRKYFLDNKQVSLGVVIPSSEYTEKRSAKEKLIAKKLHKEIGRDRVLSLLKDMHAFQNNEKDVADIPSVKVSDLEVIDDGIKAKLSEVNGVPFISSEEPCNGIVYATIAFPVDVLKPEDYLYLPLLEETLTDMGWGNLSWEKAASLADKLMGSLSVGVRRGHVSDFNKKYMEENPLIVGREWLVIRFKFLEDKTDEVFSIIEDCISGVNFSDSKRLKTIICGAYSGINSSLVPHAHSYAVMRAMRSVSRTNAISEIMDGITCRETFGKLKKMKALDIQNKLQSMFSAIKTSGALVTVVADKKGISLVKKRTAKMVQNLDLAYPKPKRKTKLSDFVKLTDLEGKTGGPKEKIADEVILIPGDIGFACSAVESSPYGSKEYVEDMVVAHVLEKTELWTKIRMAGGAYGVFLNVNGDTNLTRYCTYRDPKPFESLRVFDEIRKGISDRKFSQEEIEHSICGIYADDIEPMTPASRGMCGIMRILYGGSSSACNKRISRLLKIKQNGTKKSCMRYSKAKKIGGTVVLCGKSLLTAEIREKCGKIIKLHI